MDLKSLISGTDIRGIVEDHGNILKNLTIKEIDDLAKGFANFLIKKTDNKKLKVSIGYDARLTGPFFLDIIEKRLIKKGIDVLRCGMAITPSMFMTTVFDDYDADGAIMITASHLPSYYNGLKFFTKKGGCEKTDLIEMIDNIDEDIRLDRKGTVIEKPLVKDYSKYLVDYIIKETGNDEKPLKGFKILLDSGNGSSGFFAKEVIEKLGADTKGSQFLDPDGTFPNHAPNPETKEAIESIKEAVLKNNADFGIIFDADGDRSAFIDDEGREINRNALIALLSDMLLKKEPNSTIVTDSITSTGLKKFIESRGGEHHRYQRGYKNVINEAKRLNELGEYAPLAIETSGHAAFLNNYFLDDGAYVAAILLIQLIKSRKENKKFTDVLNDLEEAEFEKEYRFLIKTENFKEYGNKILKNLSAYVENISNWEFEKTNYEGARIICNEKDWFLLRLSLHEPLLCLNIESETEKDLEDIENKLYEFLKTYSFIDLKDLKNN